LSEQVNKPDLNEFFRTGNVDRIFHQKYCYQKALKRALLHNPESLFLLHCVDNIRRGVTIVD